MHDKRLTYLLRTWSEWQQRDDTSLGYPSEAAGIRWRPGTDSEALLTHLDETMARAVDLAVDELPLMERTAVYAVVIGPMVWRLREPVGEVYERARERLKVTLNGRGIE